MNTQLHRGNIVLHVLPRCDKDHKKIGIYVLLIFCQLGPADFQGAEIRPMKSTLADIGGYTVIIASAGADISTLTYALSVLPFTARRSSRNRPAIEVPLRAGTGCGGRVSAAAVF
jgi:hypothetical protein